MVYRIVVSFGARRDSRDIKRYISHDSPQAAGRFAELLRSKTKILGSHPEIGRVVPEINNLAIREIIIGNYRVVYKVDSFKKQIEILSYWHAARGTPDIRGSTLKM